MFCSSFFRMGQKIGPRRNAGRNHLIKVYALKLVLLPAGENKDTNGHAYPPKLFLFLFANSHARNNNGRNECEC